MKLEKEIESLRTKLEELEKKIKDTKFESCNNLMWSNSIGKGLNWSGANQFAKECRDGGFTDWRLPTVSELQNVFDYEKGEPKIDGFETSNFWSSTEQSDNAGYAWGVNLNYGNTYNVDKTSTGNSVRCVHRDLS